MMILNSLIAVSLILLSVVKTADLFIQSNRSLEKLQSKFVKTTKELIAPPKGNISLMAAILTALLSSMMLFYIIKMKTEYAEALYRKKSYLCSRYLNRETEKYIFEMAVFNWTLRAAFIAKSTILASAQSEIIWRGVTIARNIRHFNYVRKILKNKFCQFPETTSYFYNSPYKTQGTFTLETLIDETSILRSQKWTTTYYQKPSGIRLKKSFCLKSSWQLTDAFSKKASIQTEELGMVDLSNLKCFFGSSSSPPS
jgi:hypothetical protein